MGEKKVMDWFNFRSDEPSKGSNVKAPGEEEDLKLIEAFERGSREAFDRLLEKYRGEIFGLALRMVGNEEDAEEIAQQTFINALTHLRGFRRQAAFRTWLYRIAINVSRSHVRRRRPVELLSDGVAAAVETRDPPLRVVLARDEVRRVAETLKELSEKQRLAVVLRAVNGLDYEDVGRIIGCSAKTAKVHFHYGVENLRKKMKPE
jgi:RNA polymerase sigma-70 factor, ECF subfamily